MKTSIETHPNQDCATIHARNRFPEVDSSYSLFGVGHKLAKTKELHPMVAKVAEVKGIVGISTRDYSMTITKARLFSWDELLPTIIAAIEAEPSMQEQTEAAATQN